MDKLGDLSLGPFKHRVSSIQFKELVMAIAEQEALHLRKRGRRSEPVLSDNKAIK